MREVVTLPRFTGKGYVARLQRKDFAVIGQGGGWSFESTFVLAKPGSDAVVKVGTYPAGDPWPHYAAWCIENPGPLRPTVRAIRWHGSGMSRFFVATMVRLRDVDWRLNQPLLQALHDWYELLIRLGIDHREWHSEPLNPGLVEALADRIDIAGLPDVASFIRTVSKAFPSFRWDPQPSNWMTDAEGRLVMIDPFTRTPYDLPEVASPTATKGATKGL